MTKKEFSDIYELNSKSYALEPWEFFYPSIESVYNNRRIVYDYKQILAIVRKNSFSENELNEWLKVNVFDKISKVPEKFRPFIVKVSKTEEEAILKSKSVNFQKLYKLEKYLAFQKELLELRQLDKEFFSDIIEIFLKRWYKLI